MHRYLTFCIDLTAICIHHLCPSCLISSTFGFWVFNETLNGRQKNKGVERKEGHYLLFVFCYLKFCWEKDSGNNNIFLRSVPPDTPSTFFFFIFILFFFWEEKGKKKILCTACRTYIIIPHRWFEKIAQRENEFSNSYTC
jgi:hypothetical protein